MSVSENPVRIRTARPYDAAALLELKRRLDEETAFMMYEPGERDSSVRDLARDLCLLVDGTFVDELTMAVILPAPS